MDILLFHIFFWNQVYHSVGSLLIYEIKIYAILLSIFFFKLWFFNFVEPMLSWCQTVKDFPIWSKELLILWCAYWIYISPGWAPFLILISTSYFVQPSHLPRMKYIFQYLTWDSHLFKADIIFYLKHSQFTILW